MKFYALFQKQQIGGALLKRIFAFFLSLLLILGICPMSALADTGGSGNLAELMESGHGWSKSYRDLLRNTETGIRFY